MFKHEIRAFFDKLSSPVSFKSRRLISLNNRIFVGFVYQFINPLMGAKCANRQLCYSSRSTVCIGRFCTDHKP